MCVGGEGGGGKGGWRYFSCRRAMILSILVDILRGVIVTQYVQLNLVKYFDALVSYCAARIILRRGDAGLRSLRSGVGCEERFEVRKLSCV